LTRINKRNEILAEKTEKLQKRKNQFEIIAANMQEGLLILDRENNILHCNKSAKLLLGSNNNDNLYGQNVLFLCRNNNFRKAIKQADENQDISFEFNGKMIKIIANPFIISGIRMGTAVLLVDISEQADREKLRREFSANVSHELKTPLSVISGYSEIISNGLAKPEDIEEIGKKIYTEAQHLLTLINDIIQISNLDESGDFVFEKVNIFDFTENAILRLKPKAEEKNITIKLFSAIDNKNIEISAVPHLLDEILFNITENAIKYNKKNGKVEVSISKKDNFAVIEIFDTGRGIPGSRKHRVCERFYRVDSSRTGRKDGTGLGLSIVKHAVKIHNGNIKLTSSEGEWTKVTVSFPI
jgi:two-component system phosphate regulon sensor histidine kinase PhoR